MRYVTLALFVAAILCVNSDAEAARRRPLRKIAKPAMKGVCKVVNGVRVCR